MWGLFTAPAAASTPLSSSVLLLDARRLDACEQLVDRAASVGGGRVQVVVTLHVRLTDDLRIREFGLLVDRTKLWRDPRNFWPLDDELKRFFRAQLVKTFRRAAHHGLDVAVLPHLDAVGDVEEWRNYFRFDPTEKVRGRSYQTDLIEPIVVAIEANAAEGQTVWFSLGGEMGHSLFRFPIAYHGMVEAIRERIPGKGLRVGVGLNHNDLAGNYRSAAGELAEQQALFDACDFIGFSCYRPFALPPSAATFRQACTAFKREFSALGLHYPDGVPLHFSEIGLGGAPPTRGEPTPLLAAAEPWQGVATGPSNPWAAAPMRQMRRRYYASLLDFLASEPAEHRPAAAFLWSEGSWEPAGVDHALFADQQIIDQIRAHNRRVDPVDRIKQVD